MCEYVCAYVCVNTCALPEIVTVYEDVCMGCVCVTAWVRVCVCVWCIYVLCACVLCVV